MSSRKSAKEEKPADKPTSDSNDASQRANKRSKSTKAASKTKKGHDRHLVYIPISKKLITTAEKAAMDAAEGFVLMHRGLRLLGNTRNVVRADISDLKGKVAVISGGGSGHEPFAIGTEISQLQHVLKQSEYSLYFEFQE